MKEKIIYNADISAENGKPILFSHICSFEKSFKPELHLHDYLEIHIYISGNADFIINNTFIKQKSGNVLFMFPNELHCPVINCDTEYERYYIGISNAACLAYLKLRGNPLACFFDQKSPQNRLISLDENAFSELLKLLKNIDLCIEEKAPEYLASAYFMRALYILSSGNISNKLQENGCKPKIISDVLDYIGKNFSSLTTVEEIASHFYISQPYLSTIFSKTMNIGLKQYLLYTKIAHSKLLLQQGRSVSSISLECGFGSCSYFIYVFKKVTGMTPNQYRKNQDF